MKKIHIIFCTTLLQTFASIAMNEQKTHLLVIPGQNGMGGQNVDTVIPYFAKHNRKYDILTPTKQNEIDFGQKNCQKLVKEKISRLKQHNILNDNDHQLIHGSSQGTATTINYVANNPQNIKGIILESVLLTGNSAIAHTTEKVILPEITTTIEELPTSSYYALPYTAKPTMFPSYSPTGEQPIFNADKLPTDLLVIILHNTQDFQLNFKDAQGLYAFLKQTKKNKNVYFIPHTSEQPQHINLLTKKHIKEIAAINAILRLHNILPSDNNNHGVDLNEYQPEPKQEWLDHFNEILRKEEMMRYVCSSTTSLDSSSSSCIIS